MIHHLGTPPLPSPNKLRHEALNQGYMEVGDPAASNQLEALKRRAANLTTKVQTPSFTESQNLLDEDG